MFILGIFALIVGAIATTNAINVNHIGISAAAAGVLSSDRGRSIFKSLQAKYGSVSTPAPAYLRVEQMLSNTSGKYTFDIKKNGNETNTEVKLDRNDLFVVTDIGVYLSGVTVTTKGIEVLQTYPNSVVFTAMTGTTVSHLEAIYNGYLQLKIGQKVNIERLSMLNFRHVPITQQATGASNVPGFANSQYSVEAHTYKPGSLLYLHGTSNIEITIQFPTIASMAIQATTVTTNYNNLVFVPYGYLLSGAAQGK